MLAVADVDGREAEEGRFDNRAAAVADHQVDVSQQKYFVDALYNKHYIGLLKKQLGEAGVHLLHYYVFNAAHSVSLTVGLKGNEQEADDYMRRIRHRPELTIFHGRSELNRQGIRKVGKYNCTSIATCQ